MIVWGQLSQDRNEGRGRFHCPRCHHDCEFELIRTWEYFHIYFIPLMKYRLLGERVQCHECNGAHPITVLAGNAPEVSLAFDAANSSASSLANNFGNIVRFTDAAVVEILQRHKKGQFANDVVVRVRPDCSESWKVLIAFDIALADGRDWIGESNGIPVVVDRTVAPQLQGSTIDFREGEFARS